MAIGDPRDRQRRERFVAQDEQHPHGYPRSQVQVADKEGDAAKIQQSLVDLQQYVAHHMNTLWGRVSTWLSHTTELAMRLFERRRARPTQMPLFINRQASSAKRISSILAPKVYSSEYVACVVNKLHALGAGSDGQPSIVAACGGLSLQFCISGFFT